MKKLIVILSLMIMGCLYSTATEKEIEQERNNFILSLNFKQIVYDGQSGYFISKDNYKRLFALIDNYYFINIELQNNNYEKKIRRLKIYNNALWVSTGIFAISFIGILTGILTFSLLSYYRIE